MSKTIVFHSYKGGTGKTTLAANFAAYLARSGQRVILLDLDVYAPSLQSYFQIEPEKWINDFLNNKAEINDILTDLTAILKVENESNVAVSGSNPSGKLWVGFCNAKKEEIYKLEGGKQEKVQFLRRFIVMREQLLSTFDADFLIVDTSPGIRYWSINSLAIADILYLTLKAGDLDMVGTKRMAEEIYSTFTRLGAKSYLILNKVAGYCVPHTLTEKVATGGSSSLSSVVATQANESQESIQSLSNEIGIRTISAMPCFCDIQFSKKEYLTALYDPDHPFSKKIADLVEMSQMKTNQ